MAEIITHYAQIFDSFHGWPLVGLCLLVSAILIGFTIALGVLVDIAARLGEKHYE